MRDDRGWSQAELGNRTGKAQAWISKLESPDYEGFTLKTLTEMASAFDVGLEVRFVAFSKLVDDFVGLNSSDLAVPDHAHDPGLKQREVAALTGTRNLIGRAAITMSGSQLGWRDMIVPTNVVSIGNYTRSHQVGSASGTAPLSAVRVG